MYELTTFSIKFLLLASQRSDLIIDLISSEGTFLSNLTDQQYLQYYIQNMEQEKEKPSNFIGLQNESVGLGLVARNNAAKEQEKQNQIAFKVIRNDQNHQNLKYLLDCKNIFARQLPKMPKEYIVKLVFDRNHESMIILKNNTKVLGGICFREFKPERFAEIAFLAITSTQQIKGFGTRLMNKLKEEMQRRKVQYLVTFADNLALGYFRKQGFRADLKIAPERWKGYIKDYEGGTMMECFIHPTIDYSKITDMIKNQKEFVIKQIKELSINNLKFDGQKLQKMMGEPYIRKNAQDETEYFKINPMDIPGIKESGWTWQEHEQLIKTKEVSFLLECQNIIDLLRKQQNCWPFRQPVSIEDVPDYNLIVRQPIDVKTIEKKLNNNEYRDRQHFCEDIIKIFRNCRLYNQPETYYYKCANQLEQYIIPHLQALKEGKTDALFVEKRLQGSKFTQKKNLQKKSKSRLI